MSGKIKNPASTKRRMQYIYIHVSKQWPKNFAWARSVRAYLIHRHLLIYVKTALLFRLWCDYNQFGCSQGHNHQQIGGTTRGRRMGSEGSCCHWHTLVAWLFIRQYSAPNQANCRLLLGCSSRRRVAFQLDNWWWVNGSSVNWIGWSSKLVEVNGGYGNSFVGLVVRRYGTFFLKAAEARMYWLLFYNQFVAKLLEVINGLDGGEIWESCCCRLPAAACLWWMVCGQHMEELQSM